MVPGSSRCKQRSYKAFATPSFPRGILRVPPDYGLRPSSGLRELRIGRDGLERDLRVSPESSRRHQRAREQLQQVRARIRELEKRER